MKQKNNPIEPTHYTQLKISPLEYITANEGEFSWCIANVIKYISRYKRKNGLEDLEKAKWYLEHEIESLKKKESSTFIVVKYSYFGDKEDIKEFTNKTEAKLYAYSLHHNLDRFTTFSVEERFYENK